MYKGMGENVIKSLKLIGHSRKLSNAFTRTSQARLNHGHQNRQMWVFNSLTQQKEPLSFDSPVITWYSCGPTVYDEVHIGHASCYIRQDAIRRVLSRFQSKPVIYALGVTDVDDKIIARARNLGEHESVISRAYEKQFFDAMRLLNISVPDAVLRVSDWIPQIIKIVSKLIGKNHAYVSEHGNVFFDVESFPGNGKFDPHQLSCQENMPTQLERSRKFHPEKKNRNDFALWKRKINDDEISWKSPWGEGRPGWHIECSAFCDVVTSGSSHLGIHSGGLDLKFPHHNNEICQSEAYYGVDNWSHFFIHMGALVLSGSGEKMSKSLNNFISVPMFLDKYGSADELRVTCLRRDYKRSIVYSEDDLVLSRNILNKIGMALEWCRDVLLDPQRLISNLENSACDKSTLLGDLFNCREKFEAALCDDFDFPTALGVLVAFCETCHGKEDIGVIEATASRQFILSCLDLLGLKLDLKTENEHTAQHDKTLATLNAFRDKVRDFALGKHLRGKMSKEEIRARAAEYQVLLEECDEIRTFIDSMNYNRIKDL